MEGIYLIYQKGRADILTADMIIIKDLIKQMLRRKYPHMDKILQKNLYST